MNTTYLKQLASKLWNSIAQYLIKIISFLFSNSPFKDLTAEIGALKQTVRQFATEAINELTAVSEHDEALQQKSKPFATRCADETADLNQLKTVNQEYNKRNIFWRWYYSTVIKEQREHYGRAILVSLTLSLNNQDRQKACQDFISLCQEHVLELVKDRHPLQQLYTSINNTLAQLTNQQNQSQTPRVTPGTIDLTTDPTTNPIADPAAQRVEQLRQRLSNDNTLTLMAIVKEYEAILRTYPDINNNELKKLQRIIQLKVHPDRNFLCQDEANAAFQYFNSVTDQFNARQESPVTVYMAERTRREAELIREMEEEIAQHLALSEQYKRESKQAQVEIAKQNATLKQMDAQIAQQNEQIAQRNEQIAQRRAQMDQLEAENRQLRQNLLLQQQASKAKSQKNKQENNNTADTDEPENDSSWSHYFNYFKP